MPALGPGDLPGCAVDCALQHVHGRIARHQLLDAGHDRVAEIRAGLAQLDLVILLGQDVIYHAHDLHLGGGDAQRATVDVYPVAQADALQRGHVLIILGVGQVDKRYCDVVMWQPRLRAVEPGLRGGAKLFHRWRVLKRGGQVHGHGHDLCHGEFNRRVVLGGDDLARLRGPRIGFYRHLARHHKPLRQGDHHAAVGRFPVWGNGGIHFGGVHILGEVHQIDAVADGHAVVVAAVGVQAHRPFIKLIFALAVHVQYGARLSAQTRLDG